MSKIRKSLGQGKLKLRRGGKKIFYAALARLEKKPVKRKLKNAPTFIVCPPRSGSTVLMQAMTSALRVSYFTDSLRESKAYCGRPLPHMTAVLSKRFSGKSSFQSTYGRTESIFAPGEGEKYWKHWFKKRGSHTGRKVSDITESQRTQVTNAVGITEAVWGCPFVNKTTTLSVYIPALIEIFPDALFIHLHRDPIDTAQSLLKARRQKFKRWFGPMPDECEGKNFDSVLEAVCEQITAVDRFIERMKDEHGRRRFIDVDYEQLCRNPQVTIDRIREFMGANGAPVEKSFPLPDNFSYSTGQKVSDDDYTYIVKYFDTHPVIRS